MHGLTRSAQTLGRVLGFSQGTRMNDMFKQQQAKQHKELMDKTVETAWQVILKLENIKIDIVYRFLIDFLKKHI